MSVPKASNNTTVLVTGAAGFVGAHCVKALNDKGYKIVGTVRNVERDAPALKRICPDITVKKLDLLNSSLEEWTEAIMDSKIDFCLHVASPYTTNPPKNEEEAEEIFIKPAVEGTRKVLQACVNAKTVKRVVVTSSIAAAIGGIDFQKWDYDGQKLDKDSWSKVYVNEDGVSKPKKNPLCVDYMRSKTLAEQLAWSEFSDKIEIATILPGGVHGPLLINKACESGDIAKMYKWVPIFPNIETPLVDVRDVAEMHVLALEKGEAKGQRFYACPQGVPIQEQVKIVRGKEPWIISDRVLKFFSYFSNLPKIALMTRGLNKVKIDDGNVKEILGLKEWRDCRQAIKDMSDSLDRFEKEAADSATKGSK